MVNSSFVSVLTLYVQPETELSMSENCEILKKELNLTMYHLKNIKVYLKFNAEL